MRKIAARKIHAKAQNWLIEKTAELGAMDDQLMEMDATLPVGETEAFDALAEKREELEANIRKMRELVRLVSEWGKFKEGDWSDDVKSALRMLDDSFVELINQETGETVEMPGDPMLDDPTLTAPVDPVADPMATPATPAPVDPLAAPAATPAPVAPAPAAAPAPIAASVKEQNNFKTLDKKGSPARSSSTLRKGVTMANNSSEKKTLSERIAAIKTRKQAEAAVAKEAKTRVVCAFTTAKTLLQGAPAEVQSKFATVLLGASTPVLKAVLRQTAINAHWTRVAESFESVHRSDLNDFLGELPPTKEAKEILAEIKGEAKNAGSKKADDTKECGKQPEKYNPGNNNPPAELDASKAGERPNAGDRPGDTINISEGDSKKAAKTAKCEKCDGECKCASKNKKADGEEPEAPAAPAAPEAPVEGGDVPPAPPAEGEGEGEVPEIPAEGGEEVPAEGGEETQADVLTEEKKDNLLDQIDELKADVENLEAEKSEAENEELDLGAIFDEGGMEEKAAALSHEGEESVTAGDDFFGGEDDFVPSDNMEAGLDEEMSVDNAADIFGAADDSDPLAALMASAKEASVDVDVNPGEAAAYFDNDMGGEDVDNESDHEGDIFAEVLNSIKPEDNGQKRIPQDSKPKLESPKEASLKRPNAKAPAAKKANGKYNGKLRPIASGANESANIAAALFGPEEE